LISFYMKLLACSSLTREKNILPSSSHASINIML
jgi:hypothetical protein